MKWTPKICGPSSAKIPIRLEPIRPPATIERDHEPVEDDVELRAQLVEALVDEADLDLAVAELLHHVVHLVRQLAADLASATVSRRARESTRRGV